MNILFVTENFPPETNAAATRVYERALYWVRWGHSVTVITCAPNFPHGRVFDGYANRWRQIENMDGIRVVRMKTYIAPNRGVLRRSLDFFSFLVTGTWGGLLEKRPDIVSATSPQFFSAVAGWMIGGLKRVPFVFELGDLWPNSIAAVGAMQPGLALRLLEKFELFLYRRSAAVIALTKPFKDNLVHRGIRSDKISVVINGVDADRYSPQQRNQALAEQWGLLGKTVIGYIGTHGMAHDLGNVLLAAERLQENDHLRILFVGAGAEREMLIQLAENKKLRNVVFMPAQPKSEMPAIWSLCDVALVHLKDSPAFADVIPSKIFEAMAMGLPILLAAPSGEASEIIERDNAGICVPAGQPTALADGIRQLASDPVLRARKAEASRAACAQYGRDVQSQNVIAVYESVLRSSMENT